MHVCMHACMCVCMHEPCICLYLWFLARDGRERVSRDLIGGEVCVGGSAYKYACDYGIPRDSASVKH